MNDFKKALGILSKAMQISMFGAKSKPKATTESGKDIYNLHRHPHATWKDHADAAQYHGDVYDHLSRYLYTNARNERQENIPRQEEDESHEQNMNGHGRAFSYHYNKAADKAGGSPNPHVNVKLNHRMGDTSRYNRADEGVGDRYKAHHDIEDAPSIPKTAFHNLRDWDEMP